jgi:predicted ATPase with chaperone activity
MLARRLTTILPAMTLAEAIETTRIHRITGLTGDRTAWVTTRPRRAPHHTIADVEVIGGGLVKNVSRLSQPQACALVPVHGQAGVIFYKQRRGPARLPGQVSRAHHGARFTDALRPVVTRSNRSVRPGAWR